MLLKIAPPDETPPPLPQVLLQQVSTALPQAPSHRDRPQRGGHSSRGRGRGAQGAQGRPHPMCIFCGQLGHLETICFQKHGSPTQREPSQSIALVVDTPNPSSLASLAIEKLLQGMRGLLTQKSTPTSFSSTTDISYLSHSTSWIVDSGATVHMTPQPPL